MNAQIDEQLDAVNSASKNATKAHLTLLVFVAYAGVTIWSTTHEQLLRGSVVALPLLNVDVPIVSFYGIAPGLLLVLHFNLLLQRMLLSTRLHGFDDALRWSSTSLIERRRELFRLDPYLVTQGLSEDQENIIAWVGVRIAYIISIYVLPVAILLAVQLRFLPAHRFEITSWHKLAICIDVVLLWLFSWKVRSLSAHKSERLQWISRGWPVITTVSLGLFSAFVVLFSFCVAVGPKIPSWWIATNSYLPSSLSSWPDRAVKSVPRALEVSRKTLVKEAPPPELLAVYHQRGESIDSAWLEHAQGLDLTNRDLRFADFERSHLWNADFRDSRLDGAVLLGTTLRGARFTTRETLGGGGVALGGAELRETDFTQAKFPEGDLREAFLVFSDLYDANFPGSDLRKAKLWGTKARITDLRGAALARVEAQGADFIGADLRGADLRGANLMAASLSSAKLQGADLRGAKLQGADFTQAKLNGADLRDAEVFGTKFDMAELTLADLRGITFRDPRVGAKAPIKLGEAYRPYTGHAMYLYNRTLEQFKTRVLEGSEALSLEKVEHQNAIFDTNGPFSLWGNPITPQKYENTLVPALVSFACDDIHIAKGLLWERPDPELEFYDTYPRVLRFEVMGADPILIRRSKALVKGLEKDKCQSLRELPASILVELKEIVTQR